MNLIKVLDKISLDTSIMKDPIQFLLCDELHFKYEYTQWIFLRHYSEVFNKNWLNKFFEDELTYNEMLLLEESPQLELPNQPHFLPLIKERLERIKCLAEPTFNKLKLVILKSIADYPSQFISLPNSGSSIPKDDLLTLIAVAEWDCYFTKSLSFGHYYTAISFELKSILDGSKFEVYLPREEMKKLEEKFPELQYEAVLQRNV